MSKKTDKNWKIYDKIDTNFINKFPKIDRVVLQLLFNRNINNEKEIDEFLNPDFEKNTFDPFLFNDMEEAVKLIIGHIKAQNKIVIYGDYDADGVTSSAVLINILDIFKANVGSYIPDRVSEGYGLNKKAIDGLFKDDVKLIITVDGGIRNKEEVEYAKEKGLEVIITDHHVPSENKKELPDCLTINPLVDNNEYPFKNLAGVGVAYKLAKALISKSKLEDDDKKRLEERILDFVAIGTVADCVSLLGENRALVKKGLEILNNTNRVGLKELIKVAQVKDDKKMESWNIGFQIAPRLNAAGRMDHANTALELLITKNKQEAEDIARRLNSRNIERQETTEDTVEQINEIISDEVVNNKMIVAIVPEDKIWNEGVVGLVAGRISNKYYLPTLVITKGDDGYKGSGRSISEFNIVEAIEECGELLERFGGHPMACGFSLSEKNIDKFKNKIIEIANKKLKGMDLKPRVDIEGEVDLSEIDEEFIERVNGFAPFGQDNEQPKFVSRNAFIMDIITMGLDGKHIKLKLKNDKSRALSAIGFSQAERWAGLRIGDKIDIAYNVGINDFNGRRESQLKIVDIKPRDE